MGRRRESHPESRRARGRARSARVLAVHRKEADLDRFVAALLTLATEPDGEAAARLRRRRGCPGKSSSAEQTCRRR